LKQNVVIMPEVNSSKGAMLLLNYIIRPENMPIMKGRR
jgi:hypothetical protein